MEAIKFRAWDEGCKRLFNVNHVENLNNDKPLEVWTNDIEGGYRFVPNKLEQFIGLVDNQGTSIYEGDIISYNNYELSYIAKVVKSGYCFYMKNSEDSYDFEDFADDTTGEALALTVVGNVHQNLYLLED